MVGDWYTVTLQALQNLWQGVINFIPALIGAILVLVIGWFVAIGIGKLITSILRKIKFNQIFESGVWKEALAKAEWKVDAAEFVGTIVKWVLVIVFLLAAAGILGLGQFAEFLGNVFIYLGNIIVAVFIFVVAVIIADYVGKIVRAFVEGMKVGYGRLAEMIARWAIWIFAILAILTQLGIAKELIVTLFTGVVAFCVIAGGIAFGLGGKEIAAEILREFQRKLKE